jgi:hypothetical protein
VLSIGQVTSHIRKKLDMSMIIETWNQTETPESNSEGNEEYIEEEILDEDTEMETTIDDEMISGTLSNISKTEFKGVRIYDSIDTAKAKSFFKINIDGQQNI